MEEDEEKENTLKEEESSSDNDQNNDMVPAPSDLDRQMADYNQQVANAQNQVSQIEAMKEVELAKIQAQKDLIILRDEDMNRRNKNNWLQRDFLKSMTDPANDSLGGSLTISSKKKKSDD